MSGHVSYDSAHWGAAARYVQEISDDAQELGRALARMPAEFWGQVRVFDEVTPQFAEQFTPARQYLEEFQGWIEALGRSHELGAQATLAQMEAVSEEAVQATQGFADGTAGGKF